MIGLADRQASRIHPPCNLVVCCLINEHSKMLALLRAHDLECLVNVIVGILEERQRATIGKFVEGVAVVDVTSNRSVMGTLAPSCCQRDSDNALPELPVLLLVFDHERVVVQSLRQRRERLSPRLRAHVHRLSSLTGFCLSALTTQSFRSCAMASCFGPAYSERRRCDYVCVESGSRSTAKSKKSASPPCAISY